MALIKVAKVSDFNHKNFKTFRYLSKTIAVFKDKSEPLGFYAIEADCKHQNANLMTGTFNGPIVVCSRHGWKFNMKTGECLTEAWAQLRRFHLEIHGDDILVDPKPLEPEVDF